MVEESRRMLPDSPHAAERNVPNCDHSLRLPGGMSSTEDFWKFLPLDDPAIRNFFGVWYIKKMESWRRKTHSLDWTSPAAGSSKSSTSELQTL
ncbi:hypothetical protein N7499_007772 [Penicillium canescens]|nr:hypothetical protein N7499_007772 [Penicillium canescens]KAJ6158103.1 hypothetical protein N7485_010929 [Penicillium canescens]